MIKVVTVTPSRTMALGIAAILSTDPNMMLVRHYRNMVEALDGFEDTTQDVVLISLPRFEFRDYTAAQTMVRKHRVGLVAYAQSDEREFISSWMSSGGLSCVCEEDDPEEIIDIIRKTALGNSCISPRFGFFGDGVPSSNGALSGREREVLRLIAMGYTQNDIAARLFISRKTVETHRARIGRKLGAESRTELVRYALVNGLVNPAI